MFEKLEDVEDRFQEVEGLLAQPDILSDQARYRDLGREHAELNEVVTLFRAYRELEQEMEDLRELVQDKDPEMSAMAAQELPALEERNEQMAEELTQLMLPRDPNDGKNAILEIRAGTGGDEAALFAGDLFRAYTRFADRHGWKVEILNSSESGAGGFKEVIAMVSGKDVFSLYRASGSGGQHVNKTESAVRVTHIPTGVVVSCQDGKSQHKNKAKAMQVLRSRILDSMQNEQDAQMAAERKTQVGSGDRSERIRTYNFPQGRCSDHRIGLTLYKLDAIMQGDFEEIIESLRTHYQSEQLAGQQEQ
ncbi:MAG: peptide chain release factor 1 [Geobacteraceae bacterium]|nr:peptide chain release factor 1 [Geobacteraceae bacterium]